MAKGPHLPICHICFYIGFHNIKEREVKCKGRCKGFMHFEQCVSTLVGEVSRPANLENVFRGTFRGKKQDLPAKSGTVGRAHIKIFFRSRPYTHQPTEINCVPKYTVARRFGRGTVWYFCEKSNGISVITFNWVICINVGAPRQRYKKKIRLRTKSGTFP